MANEPRRMHSSWKDMSPIDKFKWVSLQTNGTYTNPVIVTSFSRHRTNGESRTLVLCIRQTTGGDAHRFSGGRGGLRWSLQAEDDRLTDCLAEKVSDLGRWNVRGVSSAVARLRQPQV